MAKDFPAIYEHLNEIWIGRMTPEKGPHRVIEVARAARRRLILAGPATAGGVGERDRVGGLSSGSAISTAGAAA